VLKTSRSAVGFSGVRRLVLRTQPRSILLPQSRFQIFTWSGLGGLV